jgi:spermidine dehydrogenase
MKPSISRRDFLNGVALTAAASAASPLRAWAMSGDRDYYPPALTGLRGSHEGAYEVAHALAWRGELPTEFDVLPEEYDLIVVGAGISGLAAALFYQQRAGADKRILILDNHDDFGGHAKRNEFHTSAGMLLAPGGSLNLQDYHLYSKEARGLIDGLGFDLPALRDRVNPDFPFANLESAPIGLYVDRAHFGEDKIVTGHWLGAWLGYGNYRELIGELPIAAAEKLALVEFVEGTRVLRKPLPQDDFLGFLRGTSYQSFLVDYVGLDKATTGFWAVFPHFLNGVGVESVSIAEAIAMGAPAASVLGEEIMAALAEADGAHYGETPEDGGVVWMPDGNASLTRQMVRRMIPEVAPGNTVEDLMTARFDYSQLDRAESPVRLRLNSTVVNAVNDGDESVLVSYVTEGRALRVKGRHCVLACYNGLIPHLCPELPEAQKAHLRYGVKVPLVAANVQLRNGRAFDAAGSNMFFCPTSYFSAVSTAPNTNVGGFRPDTGVDAPMIAYMLRGLAAASDGGVPARELYRIGRHELYSMSFADYEEKIRKQLSDMFGASGFDADLDIEAITVNRWSHGYAYEYMSLFDPDWPEGEAPHELGRKPLGRISIANSDSEAYAYVNAAIDAAWRAVSEQV